MSGAASAEDRRHARLGCLREPVSAGGEGSGGKAAEEALRRAEAAGPQETRKRGTSEAGRDGEDL